YDASNNPVDTVETKLDTDIDLFLPASSATGVEGEEVTSETIGPVNVLVPALSIEGGAQATDLLTGQLNLLSVISATLDGGYVIPSLRYEENGVEATPVITYKGTVLEGDPISAIAGFIFSGDSEQINAIVGFLTEDELRAIQAQDQLFTFFISSGADSALCKATDLPIAVRQAFVPECAGAATTTSSASDSTSTSSSESTSTASDSSETSSPSATSTDAPSSSADSDTSTEAKTSTASSRSASRTATSTASADGERTKAPASKPTTSASA
ncbi:hypothetical protein A4X03_0g9085, partial [Tilletia caries]